MTRLIAAAITIALAAALPAAAQDFSVERLDHHIRTLSDDWFEGRAPGTPGEDKTVAYLSGTFASVGLQPGGDLVDGGTERAKQIEADYAANDYHQQSDEWSPDWDLSGIVRDAQLIFAVAERLGNSDEWPNWAAGSEFKALRDASEDARD